jgi:hypothetical protein
MALLDARSPRVNAHIFRLRDFGAWRSKAGKMPGTYSVPLMS